MSQSSTASANAATRPAGAPPAAAAPPGAGLSSNGEPILCQHCGRTATNGISCEGYCVADSNY